MAIVVTVRSEGATRPSGHKLSPTFSGGIDYKETFTCPHSRDHADLFMKVLDLSAMKCGIDMGEFKPDTYFIGHMQSLITQIDSLHKYVKKMKS